MTHTADQPLKFVLFNIYMGLPRKITTYNIIVAARRNPVLNMLNTYVSTGQSSMHSSPLELWNTLLITHSKGRLLEASTCKYVTGK